VRVSGCAGRRISQRTRDALAAAKARGVELGKNGKILATENRATADRFAHQIKPVIMDLRASGITSIRALAAALNKRKVATAAGGEWHPTTVHRLIKRIDAQPERAAP
jgi:DNA invertase Pin-like site-specific DNA recombinase